MRIFVLIALVLPHLLLAQEDVDHLALASMLAKNGHYARASSELSKVQSEQIKEQPIIYYTTSGLIYLHQKQYEEAKSDFRKMSKALQRDDDLEGSEKRKKRLVAQLYLVQCEFGLKNFESVIKQIKSNPKLKEKTLTWSLIVASLWALDKKHQAWAELEKASDLFPGESHFGIQKVSYLLELALFHEAFEQAKTTSRQFKLRPAQWLRLGGKFKQLKKFDEALWFFETGVLKFPAAELLQVELAHTYSVMGYDLTAAGLFERLAARKPKYYADVAELYRKAGKVLRAQYFNSLVEEQDKKFRQRFSLALGKQNFSKAVSMKPTLSRLGLLEDQNLIYALAFTHFQLGELDPAKEMLTKINDADLFEKVVALQSTISECEDKPWDCQ